ncbi:hypothetical protein DFA_05669 [Cavenderia fasciculata]|uniref:T4 RNA ligase 1-like N-terminal domain-containing protein n=1 Tax=Cavenderia fasciculata TaxID=261658 RepID=F4PLY2_CACFS|nr:uncharacterized protein DFA_05669 [Cavenderia fasciculata]EGG23536.1 hypothetical protein DFA_05669 [Cavenderia fasciculata]|eukprot:XP_004361387.1 hypothetical protein DFA_05669 [Cavenderia fasciculata]
MDSSANIVSEQHKEEVKANNDDDYKERNKTYFPTNITIQDCRYAIKGVVGFREVALEGTICFTYDMLSDESFPDPMKATDAKTSFLYKMRRECRGIIFDESNQQLICRKLHKFFNINEYQECRAENVSLKEPFTLTEKIDGSLIAPFIVNGSISWGSKQGMTAFGKRIDDFVNNNDSIRYNDFAQYWLDRGYTPVFEYSSDKQQIILFYQEERMRLLAIRDRTTGNYLQYDEILKSGQEYGVPVVERIKLESLLDPDLDPNSITTNELVNIVKKMKNVEGFVLRVNDGRMYKIKSEWYIDLSRLSLQSPKVVKNEKDVWSLVLSGSMDDTLAMIASSTKPLSEKLVKIKEFSSVLIGRIEECARIMIEFIIKSKVDQIPRGRLQTLSSPHPLFSPQLLGFSYAFYNDIQADHTVDQHLSLVNKSLIKRIKEGCGSGAKLEHARTLLGGNIKFTYIPPPKPTISTETNNNNNVDQDGNDEYFENDNDE